MATGLLTFLDELVVTEDDDTDVVWLQVEGHALESGAELYHLLGLDVLEAVDTGDTVADAEDLAGLFQVGLGGGSQDPLLQDGRDLGGGGGGRRRRQLAGHHAHRAGVLGDLKNQFLCQKATIFMSKGNRVTF